MGEGPGRAARKKSRGAGFKASTSKPKMTQIARQGGNLKKKKPTTALREEKI